MRRGGGTGVKVNWAEEVTVSLKESVDVMKHGSWKMALALAFCKRSKVGEDLNICKNALSNLTGWDKASHTKKNNHTAREGSADTAKGVQQVQPREYSRSEDPSDHNYSRPSGHKPQRRAGMDHSQHSGLHQEDVTWLLACRDQYKQEPEAALCSCQAVLKHKILTFAYLHYGANMIKFGRYVCHEHHLIIKLSS